MVADRFREDLLVEAGQLIEDRADFNEAYHALKLLAGGVAGAASRRKRDARVAHPRDNARCGSRAA